MIVVTGATGRLGGAVVEQLLERVPADAIGVSVRDPAKAAGLAGRGVRVRHGDFDDAGSLTHAFEGAEQVLLVSAATTGEAAVQQHRTAIGAAATAGVRRIVYTSHMGVNPASPFAPMPDHAATEAMLEESGLAFTALRNGFYASSGLMLLGRALETGEVAAPADGPVSWTDHDDLAEAAAIVLTEGGVDGPTPPLTGTEALDSPTSRRSPPTSPAGRSGGPSCRTRSTGRRSSGTVCRNPRPTCSWTCSPRAGRASSRRSTRPSSASSAGHPEPSATSSGAAPEPTTRAGRLPRCRCGSLGRA